MKLTKDQVVELFTLHVRGAIAQMFQESNVQPNESQWAIIRGEVEPTMRDIGEICGELNYQPAISFFKIYDDAEHTEEYSQTVLEAAELDN